MNIDQYLSMLKKKHYAIERHSYRQHTPSRETTRLPVSGETEVKPKELSKAGKKELKRIVSFGTIRLNRNDLGKQ